MINGKHYCWKEYTYHNPIDLVYDKTGYAKNQSRTDE